MSEPHNFEDVDWTPHFAYLLTGDFRRMQDIWERVPFIPDIDAQVLKRIEADPEHFGMFEFHFKHNEEGRPVRLDAANPEVADCGTTHCIAGWATVIAGKTALELEYHYGCDSVAAVIFAKATGSCPLFRNSNEAALKEMRERVEHAKEKL